MKTTLIALGAALTMAAATAEAATITQTTTFNFNGTRFYAADDRTFTSADGALTVDVTAKVYNTPSLGNALVTYGHTDFSNTGTSGLYINSSGDTDEWHETQYGWQNYDSDHRVDGYYNEILLFDFGGAQVTLTNIALSFVEPGSLLDFFSGDPLSLTAQVTANPSTTVNGSGSLFGIGASENHSAFKVTGLTVSYEVDDNSGVVPLPAGAPLLLGALGLIGLAKRRRRAA